MSKESSTIKSISEAAIRIFILSLLIKIDDLFNRDIPLITQRSYEGAVEEALKETLEYLNKNIED